MLGLSRHSVNDSTESFGSVSQIIGYRKIQVEFGPTDDHAGNQL